MAGGPAPTPQIVPIPLPKGYQRLGGFPMDSTSVFDNLIQLDDYVASPVCYAGQVISFVDEAQNTTTVYKILPDKSKEVIGVVGQGVGDLTVGAEIQVHGNHGTYLDGDVIPGAELLATVVKKMLQTLVHPRYLPPQFSIAPNGLVEVEIGTSITQMITPTSKQNDAGLLSSVNYGIVESGIRTVGIHNATDTKPFTYPTYVVKEGDSLVFEVSVGYGTGMLKLNNLGNPDEVGRILGGSILQKLTYKGIRYGFYDTLPDLSTGYGPRDLGNQLNNPQNGTTWDIAIPAGTRQVVFAYPETLREVSSVKYVELGNTEVKDTFLLSDDLVPDASGGNGIVYRVYVYKPDVPFGSAATFKVTI